MIKAYLFDAIGEFLTIGLKEMQNPKDSNVSNQIANGHLDPNGVVCLL